jgi:hypothetical protein
MEQWIWIINLWQIFNGENSNIEDTVLKLKYKQVSQNLRLSKINGSFTVYGLFSS